MKRIGIFILFFLIPLLAKTQAEERIFVFPNYYLEEDTIVNPFNPVWQQGQKTQLVLVDSLFYYTWSSGTSGWANYQSIIQIYNEKGKLVRETYRQPSLDSWNNTFYYEYSYDENDNLSIKTGIEWNTTTQVWDSSSLYQYTYDEINRLKQYIYHNWDTALDSWANYAKYLYDYDLQGNWNYYERQDWDADSSEWKWNYRFLYTYEDGVKTEFIRQNWDQSEQEWVNNTKNTYEYNTSRNLEEETQLVWQIDSAKWVSNTLITYLYNDDDGLVIEKTYLTWSSNAWKNIVLYTYAYTDFGKESEIVYLVWSGSKKGWNKNYRYLFNYDEGQNLNQEIWQEWSSGDWENDFQVINFIRGYYQPLSSSITDSTNVCYGETDGWAIVTPTGGFQPYTYLWDNELGTTDSTVYGLSADTVYHVIIADASLYIITDSVLLSESPEIITGPINGDTLVNQNDTTYYWVEADTNSFYSWTINGGEIMSGQGTGSIWVKWAYVDSARISVIETNQYNCQGDSVHIEVNIGYTNIEEIKNSNFKIFPNPFNEKTTIHFDPGKKVIWKIELLDITGKKVIQMNGLSANAVTLTRGTLKSGIYFLKISYFNKYLVRKVIIK